MEQKIVFILRSEEQKIVFILRSEEQKIHFSYEIVKWSKKLYLFYETIDEKLYKAKSKKSTFRNFGSSLCITFSKGGKN